MSEVTVIKIPKAPGNLKIGDYVLATRWSDADWNDPWAVGFVNELLENAVSVAQEDGSLIPSVGVRCFRYAMLLTAEQAARLIPFYTSNERQRFDPLFAYTTVFTPEDIRHTTEPLTSSKDSLCQYLDTDYVNLDHVRKSNDEFQQEYLGTFTWTAADKELFEAAVSYHELCDKYDELICTGKNRYGEPVPATSRESLLIATHAKSVRDALVLRLWRNTEIFFGASEAVLHGRLADAIKQVSHQQEKERRNKA